MEDMKSRKISDEVLAAFLDGNATAEETMAILSAAKADPSFREMLDIALDDYTGQKGPRPAYAMVAKGATDKLCAIRCEQYILQKFGITRSVEQLTDLAKALGTLKEDGTPMEQLGALCEHEGLKVERHKNAYLQDIKIALASGAEVIVAVDGGELYDDFLEERIEDIYIGQIPDHSVVVLSCNDDIVCYDPLRGTHPVTVSEDRFQDAWKDSEWFMVVINNTLRR